MRPAPVPPCGSLLLALLAALLGACSDEPGPLPSSVPPPASPLARQDASRAVPARAAPAAPAARTPAAADPEPAPGDLVDEAAARGLHYRNLSGEPAKRTILEAGGAGVALLDLGSDGDLDLVFTQGLASLKSLREGPGADLEVYENDGRGHFRARPGPGLSGWWTGLASGDLDGDGDADLVVGGFGCLCVLLQAEDGRLLPGPPLELESELLVGEARAAGRPPSWVTSLALFDADRDGVLDLYLGHYLELDPVAPPLAALGEGELALPCQWRGQQVYCGPRGLVPQRDRLLRGLGEGRFEDVSQSCLPEHVAGFTLAVHPFDADGDGDTDLAVANDSSPNLLLINDGHGVLRDRAFAAGIALSSDGRPEAGMGLASGDFDRDGRPDLCVTNFSDEPTALYLGADVGFANMSYRLGLARSTRRLLSWGVHMVDFDGDGWLDLFTANGHVYPQADAPNSGTSYAQADTLWLGSEAGELRPRAACLPGSILAKLEGTRGSACGDLDGDGAPDLVCNHIDAPASVGMNRWSQHSRLELRLEGPREAAPSAPRTPRDALGTRVIVVARIGARELGLLAEVQTTVGYQSASSPWLDFGLGAASGYQSIVVLWPSGRREELAGGRANRRLWLREGEGIVREEEL